MKIRIEFKVQDCWIGVFWRREVDEVTDYGGSVAAVFITQHIWICLVPCFPLHIWWTPKVGDDYE